MGAGDAEGGLAGAFSAGRGLGGVARASVGTDGIRAGDGATCDFVVVFSDGAGDRRENARYTLISRSTLTKRILRIVCFLCDILL